MLFLMKLSQVAITDDCNLLKRRSASACRGEMHQKTHPLWECKNGALASPITMIGVCLCLSVCLSVSPPPLPACLSVCLSVCLPALPSLPALPAWLPACRLPACLAVCLSASLSVSLSISLSVCLSVCLPYPVCPACLAACMPPACLAVCLSACLPVCLPVCLSVCLSACLSVCLCLSVSPSVRPSVHLSMIQLCCRACTFRSQEDDVSKCKLDLSLPSALPSHESQKGQVQGCTANQDNPTAPSRLNTFKHISLTTSPSVLLYARSGACGRRGPRTGWITVGHGAVKAPW